jgi:hypothetical protein
VFAILNSFPSQNSIHLSPCSFLVPGPCFPIIFVCSSVPSPTFVLKSPRIIIMLPFECYPPLESSFPQKSSLFSSITSAIDEICIIVIFCGFPELLLMLSYHLQDYIRVHSSLFLPRILWRLSFSSPSRVMTREVHSMIVRSEVLLSHPP